jgi:hypothetical protein
LINIKKASAAKSFKVTAPMKIVKTIVPSRDVTVSFKVIEPNKSTKVADTKTAPLSKLNSLRITSKSVAPTEVYPQHEIKQSKIPLKEDIITNPHDYETQTFSFDLQCPKTHFWPAHKTLPTSNGKAFCPKCGEPLKEPKPKQKKRHRTAGFNY